MSAQRGKEVVEPRENVVFFLVPAAGSGFERFVVALFGLFDKALQLT